VNFFFIPHPTVRVDKLKAFTLNQNGLPVAEYLGLELKG
jgi:hypothetical protein